MSYTQETTETNSFKVKNNKEVRLVFENMGFTVYDEENGTMYAVTSGEGNDFDDYAEVVLSKKPIDDNNFVGLISECLGDYDLDELLEGKNLNKDDVVVTPIMEYIQDQLEEGYGMTIKGAGYDGRSWGTYNPFGYALIITKNTSKSINLQQFLEKQAEEMGVQI